MLYGDRIARLEQVLNLWEDHCFMRRIESIHARVRNEKIEYPLTGPILHADHFRNYLLHSLNDDFDNVRFLGPPALEEFALGALFYIPANLYSWVGCGRRIYHLTAEMQAMLAATSLRGITWDDLKWPIPSFAITMDKPIADDRDQTYDCILVTKYTDSPFGPNYESIIMNVLGTDLERYKPLNKWDKPEIRKAAERNNIRSGVLKRFRHWIVKKEELNIGFYLTPSCDKGDEPIMHFLRRKNWQIDDYLLDAAILAIRIVFGVILLLETREADRYFYPQGKKKPQNVKQERRIITDESDLFLVSYEKFSTIKGRNLVKKLGESHSLKRLAYHTRIGHWRRPPGKGNDPSFPKTIWVRPTEVNLDLKPTEGLPPSVREVFRE